jgi:hypothetical protein
MPCAELIRAGVRGRTDSVNPCGSMREVLNLEHDTQFAGKRVDPQT